MFTDNELVFGSNWQPTLIGDNVSPTTYDTSPLGNLINTNAFTDRGAGRDAYLYVLVQTTAAGGTNSTVTFKFVTDSTSGITTQNVLMQTAAIPVANLIANSTLFLPLPRGSAMTSLYKRYVGLDAVIAAANLTAGAFYGSIVLNPQDATIYAGGFGVK